MQLSSRYWEASGLLCLVGQGVLFTGERERKREMGGCMSFRRNGAENMKEVKIGKWKVESENENGNELFFFFLASSSAYLPNTVLNSGTREVVQVR